MCRLFSSAVSGVAVFRTFGAVVIAAVSVTCLAAMARCVVSWHQHDVFKEYHILVGSKYFLYIFDIFGFHAAVSVVTATILALFSEAVFASIGFVGLGVSAFGMLRTPGAECVKFCLLVGGKRDSFEKIGTFAFAAIFFSLYLSFQL